MSDVASFELKRRRAELGAITDFALYGAAIGQSSEVLRQMRDIGVCAFKAYMCQSSPGYPMLGDDELLTCMGHLRDLGVPLFVHAENDALTRLAPRRSTPPGAQTRWRTQRPGPLRQNSRRLVGPCNSQSTRGYGSMSCT